MDCHGVSLFVRYVLLELISSFRYCSGGSCSDLVRLFVADLLHSVDTSLSLDEAWSLSGRVYRHHRQRIAERTRLLAHRGEAASRYQRCVLSSSIFF